MHKPVAAKRTSPKLALAIRQLHTYLAVFIAPAVLFFAVTGCLQVFSLHEARGAYQPPPFVAKLGMLHKNQVFAEPRRRPRPDGARKAPPAEHEAPRAAKLSVLALKWFFAAVSGGLVLTTLLGLWMAMKYTRRPTVSWLLLALGVAVPLGTFLLP
jgi:hypothetical protein